MTAAEKKSIEVTEDMVEAGIKEYLRPYREEDDPHEVVIAIFRAMNQAQSLSQKPKTE